MSDYNMQKNKIGTDGMGCSTYTKYPAEGAKVTKHGGNDAIHDGIMSGGSGDGAKVDKLSDGFGK